MGFCIICVSSTVPAVTYLWFAYIYCSHSLVLFVIYFILYIYMVNYKNNAQTYNNLFAVHLASTKILLAYLSCIWDTKVFAVPIAKGLKEKHCPQLCVHFPIYLKNLISSKRFGVFSRRLNIFYSNVTTFRFFKKIKI